MKTITKWVMSVALMLFAVVSFTSCQKEDDKQSINGNWLLEGYWDYPGHCPAQNSWHSDGSSVWVFSSGVLSDGGTSGSYVVKDNTLTVDMDGSKSVFEMKVDGNSMMLTISSYPHSGTSGYSSCRHVYKYNFKRTNGGSGNTSKPTEDHAPSSLSGKTIVLHDRNVKVSMSGSSCNTTFINSTGVSLMSGSSSFSYSKQAKDKANYTLSYKTKGTLSYVQDYSSNLSLILTFISKDSGVYSGINNYTIGSSYTDNVSGLFEIK